MTKFERAIKREAKAIEYRKNGLNGPRAVARRLRQIRRIQARKAS